MPDPLPPPPSRGKPRPQSQTSYTVVEAFWRTSYIEWTAASSPPPTLRWLALGPRSMYHVHSLAPSLQGGSLPKLEKLYFSGNRIARHKAAALTALPASGEAQ